MSRDISKAVAEYKKRYGKINSNEAAFFISDHEQIRELAKERNHGSQYDYEWNLISYALEAGFMIGYRKAKADMKKQKKEA